MKLLENKKALVTGSSRGIGRKIVEAFLKEGAEVWGMCTKESAGKAEIEALAAENGTAFHEFYADAGNADVLTEAVKKALAESGGFDVLVNNAGITRDTLSFRMKKEDWDSVIAVNLTSAFLWDRSSATTCSERERAQSSTWPPSLEFMVVPDRSTIRRARVVSSLTASRFQRKSAAVESA